MTDKAHYYMRTLHTSKPKSTNDTLIYSTYYIITFSPGKGINEQIVDIHLGYDLTNEENIYLFFGRDRALWYLCMYNFFLS